VRKVLAILTAVILLSSIVAQGNYVFAEPKNPEKYAPDRLLIKFKKDVSKDKQNSILKENDASIISEISQIDVKILKVPEQALEKVQAALAKKTGVAYVEKDYLLEPAVVPNDPGYSNQWWLSNNIGAETAWDVSQGSSSIPIAILDSGADPSHPDLAGKLILGKNFYNNNDDWTDICGHGTSVAGTAAAISNNGIGVAGVAWNNPIIPIKITDSNCWGYYSSMIQGIVYAADNGARAANISFHIFNGAALTDAAKYMYDRGGWVVAAAGNTGKFENYPENPYIISVGATTSGDSIAGFSSNGPFVDFSAPGSGIYTTKSGSSYGTVSGTSFSSPIVAGLVGLLASNNPAMSAQQIYDTIKSTAVDLGSSGHDNFYGWGLIDAAAALESSNPVQDNAAPSVSITSPTDGEEVSGTFTVSVDSSDNVAVSNVELYVDNSFFDQKINEPYDFLVDAGTLTEGIHVLKAVSYDTSDNSAFSQINVNAIPEIVNEDTTPPDVSIVSPSDGDSVNGRVRVSVSASDSSGIDVVRIYLDGTLKKTLTDSPYSYTWNTKRVSTGIHSISAQAYDTMGNSNEDSISVDIQQAVKGKGNGKGKQSDVEKSSLSEISYFKDGVVLLSSSSTAGEILRQKLSDLKEGDVTNLGFSVSEAAKLHKLLAHSTKEYRDNFKILFHEYKYAVKSLLGIGGVADPSTHQSFTKQSIKIESQISKQDEEEQRKNKITTAINISKHNKEFQKLRNQIGLLESDLSISETVKDKKLQKLYEKQKDELKELLILNAKWDGKTLSESDLQEIEIKSEKQSKSKSSSGLDDKNNDVKSNNGNSKKENSAQSSSDKGKGNDKKDNKSNKGKGKSK